MYKKNVTFSLFLVVVYNIYIIYIKIEIEKKRDWLPWVRPPCASAHSDWPGFFFFSPPTRPPHPTTPAPRGPHTVAPLGSGRFHSPTPLRSSRRRRLSLRAPVSVMPRRVPADGAGSWVVGRCGRRCLSRSGPPSASSSRSHSRCWRPGGDSAWGRFGRKKGGGDLLVADLGQIDRQVLVRLWQI